MGVVNRINEGRETIRRIPTSPEEIKAKGLNLCRSAINTCKGSPSLKTHLTDLAGKCAMYPVNVAGNALTACKDIISGHPIDGVCTAFKGAGQACTDAIKITGKATVGTATTTGRQTLKAGKTLVEAPVKVPMAAGRTVKQGFYAVANRLESTYDKVASLGATTSAPANDNAASEEAAPPPPMQKAA